MTLTKQTYRRLLTAVGLLEPGVRRYVLRELRQARLSGCLSALELNPFQRAQRALELHGRYLARVARYEAECEGAGWGADS